MEVSYPVRCNPSTCFCFGGIGFRLQVERGSPGRSGMTQVAHHRRDGETPTAGQRRPGLKRPGESSPNEGETFFQQASAYVQPTTWFCFTDGPS